MGNIEDRWEKDAEWYKEDAKKNPEKYLPENNEIEVTTEELEKYIDNLFSVLEEHTPRHEELVRSVDVPKVIKKSILLEETKEERARFNEWKKSLKPFIIK